MTGESAAELWRTLIKLTEMTYKELKGYKLPVSQDMIQSYYASHLNYYGAVKFTEYLGKELKYRYELADHRGDSKYDSWEKDNKNIAEQVN